MTVIDEITALESIITKPVSAENDPLHFKILQIGQSGQFDIEITPNDTETSQFQDHSNLPLGLGPSFSSPEDIKSILEEKYLKPKPILKDSYLNNAQENWDVMPDYHDLLYIEPSKPRTTLQLQRHGLDSQVTGFTEIPLQSTVLTAKTSTSLLREPGERSGFVRGKSSYVPFAPGGLDQESGITSLKELTKEIGDFRLDTEDLASIPPGFDRGLIIQDVTSNQNKSNLKEKEDFSGMLHVNDTELDFLEKLVKQEEEMKLDVDVEGDQESVLCTKPGTELTQVLDSVLPATSDIPETTYKAGKPILKKHEWAHVVDVNQEMTNFHDLVPELAFPYPFELDTFQKQAVYHLERGDSVFVAAHTSAGKTAVAEYAIALAQKHMTRAIYTSPIKALSNQKFRDFKNTFEDVGILTGDVQIKPEASCLIMTTEILRSMLYKGADLIRDVEFVIFDEVHYVNDIDRGVVWEEVIIMLPAHVNLILLSATVPNTKEFADWVGRTKKKDIYVISTPKRPVPLEHHLYVPNHNDLLKIVDAKKNFLEVGYKKAADAATPSSKKDKDVKTTTARGGRGGRSTQGNFGPKYSTMRSEKADKNMWIHMVGLLKKKGLLPVVNFTFSKKKCEEYSSGLSGLDLLTASEKSEVHIVVEKSLMRLNGDDRELPQILRMRELMSRGIAVHHGGLLPIMKEMVEILFARGLVKVLFATETFAMGVNMPARTVVFSSIRKHDGRSFRDLLPGEYTQMSGRAGRRGLDDTGVVVIACPGDIYEKSRLSEMILGKPTKLESQFRLTYNMILNLLRVEALKVEEMIKRSFSENTSQRALPDQEKLFQEVSEKSLQNLKELTCPICTVDIDQYYDTCARILEVGYRLNEKIVTSSVGIKSLNTGRIVIVNNSFHRNCVGVILKPSSVKSRIPAFSTLVLTDDAEDGAINDLTNSTAPLPVTKINIPDPTRVSFAVVELPHTDFAIITKTSIKVDVESVLDGRESKHATEITQKLLQFAQNTVIDRTVENDWSKIRELEFQELSRDKNRLMSQLDAFQCTSCPDLQQHYAQLHNERILKMKLEELQLAISGQNLELLPHYHQRVEVLKTLGYIDPDKGTVLLKGRVACEINSADELVLTELILNNVFADLEPAEVVALLSCFVFQEKNAGAPSLTPRLEENINIVKATAIRIADIQESCGLPIKAADYIQDNLKFGLVEVVYEWARGMSFKQITELTDVLEGSIVRCITRLDETCREVKDAARMVGDARLFQKMEAASEAIKRDIVFAASLYF
ncbi:antiviral helicase [Paraphysoderma sedebokerense]|nr:antiviral helicase [Paraphysoderma sedebokerense]